MTADDTKLKSIISWYFTNREQDVEVSSCPQEETLYDYLNGTLEQHIEHDVERHLTQCDQCLQTIIAMSAFAEEAPEQEHVEVPDHLQHTVLGYVQAGKQAGLEQFLKSARGSLVSLWDELRGLFSMKQPEFVYVRGSQKVISKSLVVLEKEFKDVKLDIEIEKTGANATDIKITATDPRTGELFPGVRLDLRDGSRELESFSAEHGEALFENIVFGEYTLIAWDNKKKLGEVKLSIKE